jgi:hypothetical protein
MALTRRQIMAGMGLTGAGLLAAGTKWGDTAAAVPGDPVEAALDQAIAAIEQARAAHRATPPPPTATAVPPTNTPPPPTATGVPPTATSAPQAGGIRLVVPSLWLDNDTAIQRFIDAGVPRGSVLAGGTGIRNSDGWYAGSGNTGAGGVQFSTREPKQVDRYARAHAAGLLCLTYIGLGNLGGGIPASSPGKWNDLGAVKGKITKNFQLYPECDGIFLDEFPWSGFAGELAQIRDHIRATKPGALIVANAAGWQGHDAERDNVNYVDILGVFESGYRPINGSSGPYFGNPETSDGYSQPTWFHVVPPKNVAAFVHSVPDTQAAIDQAFATAKAQGIGNLYLTDINYGSYYWGDCPSASFMAKLFAKLRQA